MTAEPYTVRNTTAADLEFVYWLFDEAIAYQQRKGFSGWTSYDKAHLHQEVTDQRQFKIVYNGVIVCIYSICLSDRLIWRTRENGDAVYLHRIVVNPHFKGRRLFGKILEWAIDYGVAHNLKYIRMDTWADNPGIIAYYGQFGFTLLETYTTPDTPELPIQHRDLHVALLEYAIPFW